MRALGIGLAGLGLICAMGCSPKADPVGKGQMYFSVEFPDPTLGTCGLSDQGGVGNPYPDPPNPDLTVDDLGGQVVDGQSDSNGGSYEVQCTVKSSGNMEIVIKGPNHQDFSSRGTASIEVYGTLGTDDGDGTADVTVRTVNTGAMASQGRETCTLKALPDAEGDPAVGAGSAAFVFECPNAVSSLDQFSVCATRGTVIVTDCLED